MKILQLANKVPYPPKDGGAIATLNLSKGLAKLGHEIFILALNTSKHYVDLEHLPSDMQHISIRGVKIDTDLSITAALKNLFFSRNPYNAERFFSHEFSKELSILLQEHQFDVIQLEGLYMAWYIDIIRKYTNAPIALRAHNIEHEIWERNAQQEKFFLKKWYLRLLAKRIRYFKMVMMNRYDLLIPITHRDARQFSSFGNTKPMHVVPAGFDMSLVSPHRELTNFPTVFFIGTLDWFPNQEGLVWFTEKVWPALLKKHPSLVFNVAGRNAPQWIVKLLKNKPNITFFGEIDEAYEFIINNAIMIAPLFSGSGMRVKIIEGMALGKTIVTTSIGAEGIDVKNGVNIIIEDDERAFLQRIDELIADRQLFDTIGSKANEFVKLHYDNHKISESLAGFYKQHI